MFPYDVKEMTSGAFRDASKSGDKKTSVATIIENKSSQSIPVTTLGVIWDKLEVTFLSDSIDKFSYSYQNELKLDVIVTYQNASKNEIIRVEREFYGLEI